MTEFFIAHLILCLIYFIFSLKYRGFQEAIYRFIIVFLLPVFGFIFFFICALLDRFLRTSDTILESYLRYIQDKSHIHYAENVDFDKEINVIPVADSLYFSDKKSRRSYLIYLLKKDFLQHIKGLNKALESDDSETAHYAAAALMEIKRQFEFILQSAWENYEKNNDDIAAMQEYVTALKKYMKSNLLDRVDYGEYLKRYSFSLGKLLEKYHENAAYFSDKISADIELYDYASARETCKKFFYFFPNSEEPYIMLMKLYFQTHDYSYFERIACALRYANFNLSSRAESIIKYWERERTGADVS